MGCQLKYISPDGTPFQDRAKYPKYLPGSFNKHTWFSGWPVPFKKNRDLTHTLTELEAEYKAAVAANAEYEAAEAELAKAKADPGE